MPSAPTASPASSKHVTSSEIHANAVLPHSRHLTGSVALTWGGLTSVKWSGNAIACALKTRLAVGPSAANDYVAVDLLGGEIQFTLRLVLHPSPALEAHSDGLSGMERERHQLTALCGQTITIDCSRMRVENLEKLEKGRGMWAALEGVGERQLWSKPTGITKILSDPPESHAVPSWFENSSASSIPSPTQHRSTTLETSAQPVTGPSRLRPLSTHVVPSFPKLAPADKACAQPGKRPASPKSPPGKRTRLEDVDQAPDPVPAMVPEVSQEVRTVIQLGPPSRDGPASVFASRWQQASEARASSPDALDSDPHDAEMDIDKDTGPQVTVHPAAANEVENREPREEWILESNADRRRKAEEAILARRRKQAEATARVEAEARLTARDLERKNDEDESTILKRSFTVSDRRYTPIVEVAPGIANIVGVVVANHPPRKTKFRDWSMSIVIGDPSSHIDNLSSDDFVVTVFRRTVEELPTAVAPGTPILFRGIKVTMWHNKPKGQAFTPGGPMISTNTWATLPGVNKLKLANEHHMTPALGKVELERMRALGRWWAATNGGFPGGGSDVDRSVSGGSEIYAGKHGSLTLSEVREGMFFDAIFKIMHVITNTAPRPALELYVSDGTVSPHPTRNYHNVDLSLPPNAVFSLAIKDLPPVSERRIFETGGYVKMSNVRAKCYQGGLELIWSELVTGEQHEKGWNRRRCAEVGKGDEMAEVVEARIRALKRGEDPKPPLHKRSTSPQEARSDSVDLSASRLATHVHTIYNDPIEHAITPISAILTNGTIPNKFRVQARVKSVHPRGSAGSDSLVQQHCMKCSRDFTGGCCRSCNDTELDHAELRYRFLAMLEQGRDTLPVIIADQDAADFLPPLPPMSASTNPNDERRTQQRIREASARVHDTLLGAKQDGERTRPTIDLSLEILEVRQGPKEKKVIVARVFGMTCGI